MFHIARRLWPLVVAASLAAQTKVDLRQQSRNVDFSNSGATLPMRTGTALPVQCAQGEMFFKTDAPAGSNVYGCSSPNVWTLEGGAEAGAELSFKWTQTAPAQAQISPGVFRFGKLVTRLTNGATVQISGSASGGLWIYAVSTGSVVVGHNLGGGAVAVSGTGFVTNDSASGFPTGVLPLYQCSVSSGQILGACDDLRSSLGAEVIRAGGSGLLEVDCETGDGCLTDLAADLLPTLAGANSFTGLNTFSRLRAPQGNSLPGAECDESGEAGKLFVKTDDPSGAQFYVCEGSTGWKLQRGARAAGVWLPFGWPWQGGTGVALGAAVRVYQMVLPAAIEMNRLAFSVATPCVGSCGLRAAIYGASGSGECATQIAKTAVTTDLGTPGVKTVVFPQPVMLEAGSYWLALVTDSAALEVEAMGSNGLAARLLNAAGARAGVSDQTVQGAGPTLDFAAGGACGAVTASDTIYPALVLER